VKFKEKLSLQCDSNVQSLGFELRKTFKITQLEDRYSTKSTFVQFQTAVIQSYYETKSLLRPPFVYLDELLCTSMFAKIFLYTSYLPVFRFGCSRVRNSANTNV